MPVINNILLRRDETKIFRIFNGSIAEITESQSAECLGGQLTIMAANAVGELVGGGRVIQYSDGCAAYPGAIIHKVPGSLLRQPLPITYGILKNRITLVSGTIAEAVSAGDTGGDAEAEITSDPNFGGELPVDDPSAPSAPGAPPSLPSGNGNTGFTTGGIAGAQTGITGGNA